MVNDDERLPMQPRQAGDAIEGGKDSVERGCEVSQRAIGPNQHHPEGEVGTEVHRRRGQGTFNRAVVRLQHKLDGDLPAA